jgi:hypothetical protein
MHARLILLVRYSDCRSSDHILIFCSRILSRSTIRCNLPLQTHHHSPPHTAMGILLSICCVDQDSEPNYMESSSIPPCPTRPPPPAPFSSTSSLSDFGSATIYTPDELMEQMYGITQDNSKMSVRQPQHPLFVRPRIKVIPPTFATLPHHKIRLEDAAYLRPPRERFVLGRQHVAEIKFY